MTDNDIINGAEFAPNLNSPVQTIKVIGVGGGGNNAVMHMYNQGIKDVSFVLINTDRQVLDDFNGPTKLIIGPGLGAGGDPVKASKYAEESADAIADLFNDNTNMVFITAGMGGGTGTGAGPVVARIAKEMGILTVGIVTVPFLFEGRRKVLKALEGAEEMAKNVDSLLVINNQRLTEIYQNLDIFNAFAKADDTLLTAAQSITNIITTRGVINRDFNDVDRTLREGGTAIISTGYGEGQNRVTAAIRDALHSPLLRNTDIFGSKKLLMVLYVSDNPEEHPFNMDETLELENFISGIDPNVDVMWGLYKEEGLDDRVKITILASGFDVSVNTDPGKKSEPTEKESDVFRDTYGSDKVLGGGGVIVPPESYDDPTDEALGKIEQTPAVNRRGHVTTFDTSFSLKTPAANPAATNPDRKKDDRTETSKTIFFDDLNEL